MMPRTAPLICVLLVWLPSGFAQNAPAPLLSPEQLDNLVAPVALYPDPLLGQVLAASTYPLEVVEAQQWFQQNGNLQGVQLMDSARQQNWDPSVQALVAFPDVLHLLGNDVRWTTDLGNAFLAQQADVMAAVQRMRSRAQTNGMLRSTPQQMVTTGTQDGQSAIEIQPASPQMMYVPVYQPEYVWGPPAYGAYPATWYPAGFGYGFGFDPGIFLNALFQGFTGWGGWGWMLNWLGHGLFGNGLFGHGGYGSGLFVNSGFFNRYGFRGGFAGAGVAGLGAWEHNPSHRMGVQYPNQAVASRFNRGYAGQFNGARSAGSYGNQFNGTRSAGSYGNQFNGTRSAGSYGNQFNGARSAGSYGNQFNGTRSAGSYGNQFNGARSAGSYGNQSESRGYSGGSNRMAANNFAGSYRQASPGYQAPAQNFRGFYSAPGRAGTPSYQAPRAQNYSAPQSYSAPRQAYSAPRESAPRQSFSAPRSFAAPRSSGGGSHGSGGHSGGGGGHSHGGGGHSGGGHHKK